jgi:hypothetical protein
MRTAFQAGTSSISKDGCIATVSIPVTFRQRSGRKQILAPPGETPWSPAPRLETSLVKAVVRAYPRETGQPLSAAADKWLETIEL